MHPKSTPVFQVAQNIFITDMFLYSPVYLLDLLTEHDNQETVKDERCKQSHHFCVYGDFDEHYHLLLLYNECDENIRYHQ